MELKTRIILLPFVFFVIYNAIKFMISGQIDVIGGIFVGIVITAYVWYMNKKAGKI